MKDKDYTLDQAIIIAKACLKAYTQWGQHADYPYYPWQMVLVMKTLMERGNYDSPTKEEHLKLRRQLSMCEARNARVHKHVAGLSNDPDTGNI